MTCGSACQCNCNGDGAARAGEGSLSVFQARDCGTGGTKKGIALAQLGQLLDYPDEEFFSKLQSVSVSVASAFPRAGKPLKEFEEQAALVTLSDLEELYTRTFDLAAIASPYITGYIYGDENFDRGTLMACLSENYARLGFDLNGELPDHLAQLLRFASLLDEETLDELISFCLLKPVAEICQQLKSCDNAYFHLLSAIDTTLNSAPSGESKI